MAEEGSILISESEKYSVCLCAVNLLVVVDDRKLKRMSIGLKMLSSLNKLMQKFQCYITGYVFADGWSIEIRTGP